MAHKMLRKDSYIDTRTGETFTKTSYVDTMLNDDGFLFRKGKHGTKSWEDIRFPKEFTLTDEGRVGRLKRFIIKDNQMLVRRSGNFVRPATIENIAREVQLSPRQCKEFIKKCKKNNILKEVIIGGITYFCFNPIYGMKDKRLSLTVFIVFQEELNAYMPSWAIKEFLDMQQELAPNIQVVK